MTGLRTTPVCDMDEVGHAFARNARSIKCTVTVIVPFLSVSRAKNSQSFVAGLNPFCCLTITSLGISCSTVPSGYCPLPALATSTVPARLPARLSTKKCFTEVNLVMHLKSEASSLYFGSPACTLPAHSKSAAKHETLPVSAKILIRLLFIRVPSQFCFIRSKLAIQRPRLIAPFHDDKRPIPTAAANMQELVTILRGPRESAGPSG